MYEILTQILDIPNYEVVGIETSDEQITLDIGVFCTSPKKVYFRIMNHYISGFCLSGVLANS